MGGFDVTRGYAYKVLGPDREAWNGGSGRWVQRKRWMPAIEEIEPCHSGYHLCRDEVQLLSWLGPVIWIAEYEGDAVDGGNKIVVGRARLVERVDAWNERSARLFACDCAEQVVHLNTDPRVAGCIAVARRFADGDATTDELRAAENAAESAAWSAAESAAWSAAWSEAERAAWSAAESAAWSAESAAYSAVRSAARSAADSAARSAAWSAAESAAWSAESAAYSAVRSAQAELLRKITGGLPA